MASAAPTPSFKHLALDQHMLKIVVGSPRLRSFAVVSEPPCCTGGDAWRVVEDRDGVEVYWSGRKLFSMRIATWERGVEIAHTLEGDEHVYGLGEKYAHLDRRFKRFHFWNVDQTVHLPSGDPMYKSIPFYIVAKPGKVYGVFVDYPGYLYIDTGVEHLDRIVIRVGAGYAVLYVFSGENLYEILDAYTRLTGRPFMPPKWAVGYHQSRYSYASQDEVLRVAEEFRRRRIPCDAIWLDIDYMDGYRLFTWSRDRFPDPRGMIEKLHSMNMRVVTIVDVGIKEEKGYHAYDRGVELNAFLRTPDGELFRGGVWPGLCVFPDFLRSSGRRYWAQRLAEFMGVGVDGIWLDMNEPAIFYMEKPFRSMVAEVSKRLIENDVEGAGNHYFWRARHLIGTTSVGKGIGMVDIPAVHLDDDGGEVRHSEIHNAYPLLENEATKMGFEIARPGRRWFILTRSAYAGIQRLAAVWTGDNQSDWGHMAISIPMLLNLGLSGVPFAGADVGGFGDDVDPEMLVRWTQLGAFYPFFRNHSSKGTRRQEPWVFGEPWSSYVAEAIRLRYRLLPYIYSMFIEAHRSGKPVIRPLFAEFPQDEQSYVVEDEFLVGPSLLVAPVLTPGARARAVYLPQVRWLDLWSGEVLEPGWRLVEAPIDRVPLFLREDGAVVTTEPRSSATEPWGTVTIDVFVGRKACAVLYDDDGETADFEKGRFFEAKVCIERRGGDAVIRVEELHMGYEPGFSKVRIRLLGSPWVERVLLEGEELRVYRSGKAVVAELGIGRLTASQQG